MPNWKKVVVSGSNVSQLVNDGVYLRTIGDGVITSSAQIASAISGAFTATSSSLSGRIDNITGTFASTGSNSFKGDQTFSGSLLPEASETFDLGSPSQLWDSLYVNGQSIYMRDTATNTFVTMSAANGVLTFNNTKISAPLGFLGGILSSSAQIATDISGAFTATSGGFSTRVTSLEGATSTYALKTDISGAFTATSGGFSTRVTSLETTVNNTTFSASIQERVTTLETDLNALESKTLVSSSAQIDHDTTTNFVANEHIDHTSVSITAGDGLSGGGTIASTRTLSLDTSSAHFTSGVKTKLNTEGVISSSAQLTSTFDTRYLNTTGDNVISSSAQIASEISGAFTAVSGGLAGRITSLEAAGGSLFSSSVSTRLTSVEGYTLDNVTDNGSTTTNGITIGGLTVNGNAVITGTLTAQQFNTEFVSSSIIFESGSTKFGDSVDDIHSFTGSVKLNTETAATTDTDKFLVFDTGGQIKYRTGAEVLSDINPGGLISSSAQLTTEFDTRYLNTTGDGVISSSAQVTISSTTGYTSFSSSIAADIAALESAGYVDIGSGASGSLSGTQRVALWQDTNTIGGDSTFTYSTEGILTVSGGTIRKYGASGWSTGTVTFGLGSPVSCVGAFITYVIYSNDAGRSSFRAGNVTAAWDNAGTSVTFNETTTTTIGTLPTITTNVSLIGGQMYVSFSQSSGTLYNVQVNVDTLGV